MTLCHSLLLASEVEKIKPGLLLRAYSACAEDTWTWLLFSTPQNMQDKEMA